MQNEKLHKDSALEKLTRKQIINIIRKRRDAQREVHILRKCPQMELSIKRTAGRYLPRAYKHSPITKCPDNVSVTPPDLTKYQKSKKGNK